MRWTPIRRPTPLFPVRTSKASTAMADKRRIAVTSGRVISGAVGIGVALVSVLAVGTLDLPVLAVEPPRTTVAPTASDQSRLCPGPLLRQGDDASSAGAAAGFA